MPRQVTLTAASRLHFGMFSFGQSGVRQFGGVGAMLAQPGLQLRFTSAERFETQGPLAPRITRFVERMSETLRWRGLPDCRIEVLAAPREHTGLGLGTSLGLALAAGLNALAGQPAVEPEQLAAWVERGARSAVGTHGFGLGGLIIEAGKQAGEALGALVAQVALPADWRFVLICPTQEAGLSGASERQAFADLPAVPREVTAELCREALLHLAPAARTAAFDEFSASVYRFGRLAGSCFAAKQGGFYASPRLAALVDEVRAMGVAGVGQSSWGPTLFALFPDETRAAEFVLRMQQRADAAQLELTIAAPCNQGAVIEIEGREVRG